MTIASWEVLFGSLFPTSQEASAERGKFFFGWCLILMECFVCVGNAILTQYIFQESELESPFIMSYIGIASMIVALPIHWWSEGREARRKAQEARDNAVLEADSFDSFQDDLSRFQCYSDLVDIASRRTMCLVYDHERRWNHRKHILAALLITPALFLADWAFNAALLSTSIASATTLVSIQSIIVYVLAVFLSLDFYSSVKLLGILAGVAGMALTAIHDDKNDNAPTEYKYSDVITYTYNATIPEEFEFPTTNTWGDALAVLAAGAYATYTIQVRLFCPENEELYSMTLLLGYIGAISLLPLGPVAMWLIISEQIRMSWSTFGMVVVKGLLDFLITDYLLFRAIILTGPTVAVVGSGMSIPIAFLADLLMGREGVFSLFSVIGALSCVVGFLVVNLAPSTEKGGGDREKSLDYEDDQSRTASIYENDHTTL
jgi:solute carrier family 35 protein F5